MSAQWRLPQVLFLGVLGELQFVDIDLPVVHDALRDDGLLGLESLLEGVAVVQFLQFSEDLLVELVLYEFAAEDGVGLNPEAAFDRIVDIIDFCSFLLYLLLLLLLLGGVFVPGGEDGVHCEKHLPEDALDERGDHVDDGDMQQAEVEHDVGEILGGAPAVIEGHRGPPRLGQNLHHVFHRIHQRFEIGELLVLVVGGVAAGRVEVVEELHAQDRVYVEDEDEQGHEAQDDRQYLE